MKHTPLSTIYYSDNSNFFTEYEKRKNSPYAFSLGIKIHDHEAFFLELPGSPMNIVTTILRLAYPLNQAPI